MPHLAFYMVLRAHTEVLMPVWTAYTREELFLSNMASPLQIFHNTTRRLKTQYSTTFYMLHNCSQLQASKSVNSSKCFNSSYHCQVHPFLLLLLLLVNQYLASQTSYRGPREMACLMQGHCTRAQQKLVGFTFLLRNVCYLSPGIIK